LKYLRGLLIGTATSILAAFFLIVGYFFWLYTATPPTAGHGVAVSWDLRSVATPHLLVTFLTSVLAFFILGFWAGYRLSPNGKSLK